MHHRTPPRPPHRTPTRSLTGVDALALLVPTEGDVDLVVEGALHYRSLLLSVAGAVLDGPFASSDPGAALVRDCVESAVAALLAELAPRDAAPADATGGAR